MESTQPPPENSNTSQPEGRQAKLVEHRADYEGAGGKEVFQWLPGIFPATDRLDKTGSGVSPAAFWSLFRRGKSDPGSGAGEAPGAKA